MSESDSDESTTSTTDKHAAQKVKAIHFRSRQASKEDVRSQHHIARSASDRRLESAPPTTLDHHTTKKSLKEAGRFKEDEFLSPINEDPDGSVPDDRADQFLREVRRQLTELQESDKAVQYGRQHSSPTAELEILNLLGTSVKSNTAH